MVERIASWQRDAWNYPALSVGLEGIRLVEVVHEAHQVAAAEAAVEGPGGCAGQQVAGSAVAVEVDTTYRRRERRRRRVGEVKAQIEAPGQLKNARDIRNASEIGDERP